MGELLSPRIYYKKAGVTYDIGVYDAQDADGAVGYLRLSQQVNWQTDALEQRYIPYVALAHTKASHVHVQIGGQEYALLRQGYIVGNYEVLYDQDPSNIHDLIVDCGVLDKNIRNADSEGSYNLRIHIEGRVGYTKIIQDGSVIATMQLRSFWWPWETGEDSADATFVVNGNVTVHHEFSIVGGLSNMKVEVWR